MNACIKYDPNAFKVIELLDRRMLNRYVDPRGDYKLVLIRKEYGVDSLELKRVISATCNIKQSQIFLYGLKDKDAIAWQYIIIPSSHLKCISSLYMGRVYPLKYSFTRDIFTKTLHVGNYFITSIKIQEDYNLEDLIDIINTCIQSRLPNYYGYQRFGIRRINHLVGRALIKGDYREAIDTILYHTSDLEDEHHRVWRVRASKVDYCKALDIIPKDLKLERSILRRLCSGCSYEDAVRVIPKNILRLYIDAYRAYLFNLITSFRILNRLPLDVCIDGDYYISNNHIFRCRNTMNTIPLAPLIGFNYLLEGNTWIDDIYEKILSREGIDIKSFYMRIYPYFKFYVEFRPLLLKVRRFRITRMNEREVVLRFRLDKGSYASIVLREIIKPINPIRQGF